MIHTLSLILGNTQKTVSNWKKEKRPIMELLYKYFTKEELEEFLETGKIEKFENIKEYNIKKDRLRCKYLKYFTQDEFSSIEFWDDNSSIPFWFLMLNYIRHNGEKFENFQSSAISFAMSQFNLIDAKNKYDTIEAPLKRIIPFLKYLDSIDGMYIYIKSITTKNMLDLRINNENEKFSKEAEIHIKKFNEFEELLNKSDIYMLKHVKL